MPRPKQPPEYFEARRALNRHLYRHHAGAIGEGMLTARLDQHEELHVVAKRIGIPVGHSHEDYPERETDIEAAHRILREGETQHGQADV